MLKLVVAAAVMLHVVASKPFTPWTSEDKAKSASKPMDVNVEVTVNGVKIPINFDPQPAGKFQYYDKEGKEPSKSGRFNWDEWHKEGKEASKSAGYGWIAWLG